MTEHTLAQDPRRPGMPPPLLAPVLHLLGRIPFDCRSPLEQRRIIQHLKRIDVAATSPAVRAKISLLLAEMALVTGDRDQAVLHFRSALAWDPGLSIHRTLDRLETASFRPGAASQTA